MDAVILGSFISQCRKEKNLTQDELGKILSVTGKAVSRWERGVGYPDISTLEPLSKALGVSLMELMKANKGNNTDTSASDVDILNETIEYLKIQRKHSRLKCMVALLFSFITMIMGIIISCSYVDNLVLRAIFVIVLIYTAVSSTYNLRGLFKV